MKGLSFQAYEDDVRGLFEQFGEVLNVKVLMRPDGKPKGIAFVKFSHKSSFSKALELNGTEQFGRNIAVEEAQGKKDDGFQRGQRGDRPNNNRQGNNRNFQEQGNANIETSTLFIGGLSYSSTVESVTDYFS